MSLDNYISEFLEYLKSIKRFSEKTVIAYRLDLIQFSGFLQKHDISVLENISDKTIRKYIIALNEGSVLSIQGSPDTSTISRKLSSLRSFFNFCLKNNYIEINPAAKISNPKIHRKLPEIIPIDSFNKIIDTINADFDKLLKVSDEHKKTDLELRRNLIKSVFEFLYAASLRVSELCGLNIGDIDFYNQTIRVRGKGNKTRIIPIGSRALDSLDIYLKLRIPPEGNYPVFVTVNSNRIYPRMIYDIVNKYLGQTYDLSKLSPHILRHSSASHMLDKGADLMAVKEILGHENLSTTQIYTHTSIEKLKKIHKLAHPKS